MKLMIKQNITFDKFKELILSIDLNKNIENKLELEYDFYNNSDYIYYDIERNVLTFSVSRVLKHSEFIYDEVIGELFTDYIENFNLTSYNKHRWENNPKEKLLHDTFKETYLLTNNPNKLAFANGDDKLSNREKRIILSTIQWLGSNCGEAFLRECGYTKEGK